MIHPHGTESSDFYKEMYLVLLGGMLLVQLMEHTVECEAEACELCRNLKKVNFISQFIYPSRFWHL